MSDCVGKVLEKTAMLKPLDFGEILETFGISKIASRAEVTESVEGHRLRCLM
jgi:hypothetical protein